MIGRKGGNGERIWIILGSALILHFICWRASTQLRSTLVSSAGLVKRSVEDDSESLGAIINYNAIYQNASPTAKPFMFGAMILWLTFLFAFVGITAADFFCPNLSTIADRLGLSESVAGVTFLAWSNGSPDVFSTFSALRAHSGSLAIGELLGAASFITMVVAGTMCLIKPFRVSPHTFLRDVGFFTIAVSFTLRILWDNHIHLWEAAAMVSLYVVYVIFVAVGSWWNSRKERKRELLRQARSEYAQDVAEYHDEVEDSPNSENRKSRGSSGATTPTTFPFPTSPCIGSNHSHQHEPLDDETVYDISARGTPITLTRRRSGSASTATSPLARRPKSKSTVRPSLLGAIEFRDVVNSLQADSSARTLAIFGGIGDERHTHATLGGTGARGRRSHLAHKRSSSHSGAVSLNDSGANSPSLERSGSGVRGPAKSLHELGAGVRSTTWNPTETGGPWDEEEEIIEPREPNLIDLSAGVENPWSAATRGPIKVEIPPFPYQSPKLGEPSNQHAIRRVPSILLTNDTGESETVLLPPSQPNSSQFSLKQSRFYQIIRAVFFSLFPSLQEFKKKSLIGKISGIFCVPAILVLNLTLPVVENDLEDCDSIEEKDWVDFQSGGSYRDVETPPAQWAGDGSGSVEVERRSRHAISTEFYSHVLSHPEIAPWGETELNLNDLDEGLNNVVRGGAAREERMIKPDLESPPSSPIEQIVDVEVVTRYLTAVQCFLAPVFCTTALLIGPDFQLYYPLIALGVGSMLSMLAFWTFKDSNHSGRIILCFVGFFVAMVWILMIVNEVVGVLQAIGKIFGLSDAILGLTIFAMGNSLGDLVANATVARMGFPSMAIAACFGGPMLNILLGIGLSGCYMIYQNDGQPYHVEMGRTLIVSGVSLLIVLVATLILVPLNGYWMNKRLGAGLIVAYVIVLATNVLVELFG